ncbi:hypothetical protein PENTCL1PPCAC_4810 [Pristionchus entomophagus]|uniref:HAT C-terminal dimerisation domain-containing protein n=1 Tax=Pristionchus entomophagus TaxID=358040 RepID=A0AAV5SRD2_9BILA|nr:hypothetical protein PENTCL1PPCAC_4810 [Pristionchus entomophagus]
MSYFFTSFTFFHLLSLTYTVFIVNYFGFVSMPPKRKHPPLATTDDAPPVKSKRKLRSSRANPSVDSPSSSSSHDDPPSLTRRSVRASKTAVPSTVRKLHSLAKRIQFPEEKDPVEFWKEHHQLFPRLAKVARCLLAIPPSSIDSERLFSTVGLVVNNRLRARTDSYTMKKLAFVGAHSRRERIRFGPDEWEAHFEGDDQGFSDTVTFD